MLVKGLASLSAALWFSQALLHLLLLLGAPLGQLVFGGLYTVFPLWLRPANLALCLLWSLFACSCLIYSGLLLSSWRRQTVTGLIQFVTVYLGLATVFNFFISTSPLEKYVTGSVTAAAFLLHLSLLYLQKSPPESGEGR